MPRPCTICSHTERGSIEESLRAGQPFRAIASRFGVGRMALHRHAAKHLPVQEKEKAVPPPPAPPSPVETAAWQLAEALVDAINRRDARAQRVWLLAGRPKVLPALLVLETLARWFRANS